MYLLSICVSSLKKIFTSSAYFLILWFLPLSYIYSLHIWDTNPFSYKISKYFHPFSRLPFYFVSDFRLLCRNFLVWGSSTCFCGFCLWSPTQKNPHQDLRLATYSLYFLLGFLWLPVLHSLIHVSSFFCTVKDNSPVSLFCMWLPVSPELFIEDTLLSPLYILGSFVLNYLTIYAWGSLLCSIVP